VAQHLTKEEGRARVVRCVVGLGAQPVTLNTEGQGSTGGTIRTTRGADEFAYVTAVTKEAASLSNPLLMRHSDEIAPARLARSCGGLNCRECLRRGAPKMLGVVPSVRVGRAT
jgi:hypothetical protein